MKKKTGKSQRSWTEEHRNALRNEYKQVVGSMDKQTYENLEVLSRLHVNKPEHSRKSVPR